jgi:hypothetical protein
VDLAGHLSLKPVVQDGRTEAPQSSNLNSSDLTVASHLLESFGRTIRVERCYNCKTGLANGSGPIRALVENFERLLCTHARRIVAWGSNHPELTALKKLLSPS